MKFLKLTPVVLCLFIYSCASTTMKESSRNVNEDKLKENYKGYRISGLEMNERYFQNKIQLVTNSIKQKTEITANDKITVTNLENLKFQKGQFFEISITHTKLPEITTSRKTAVEFLDSQGEKAGTMIVSHTYKVVMYDQYGPTGSYFATSWIVKSDKPVTKENYPNNQPLAVTITFLGDQSTTYEIYAK